MGDWLPDGWVGDPPPPPIKKNFPVYGLHVNGEVVFQASFETLERAVAGARWRVRSPFWVGATIGRPS